MSEIDTAWAELPEWIQAGRGHLSLAQAIRTVVRDVVNFRKALDDVNKKYAEACEAMPRWELNCTPSLAEAIRAAVKERDDAYCAVPEEFTAEQDDGDVPSLVEAVEALANAYLRATRPDPREDPELEEAYRIIDAWRELFRKVLVELPDADDSESVPARISKLRRDYQAALDTMVDVRNQRDSAYDALPDEFREYEGGDPRSLVDAVTALISSWRAAQNHNLADERCKARQAVSENVPLDDLPEAVSMLRQQRDTAWSREQEIAAEVDRTRAAIVNSGLTLTAQELAHTPLHKVVARIAHEYYLALKELNRGETSPEPQNYPELLDRINTMLNDYAWSEDKTLAWVMGWLEKESK